MNKKIIKITFLVYIFFIIIIVAIKFNGSISQVKDRIDTTLWNRAEYGIWNYNLVFFKTISTAFESFRKNGLDISAINGIANIILFIPLGMLLPLVVRKPSITKIMLFSLSIILTIEIFQFVTCLGVADVDDVISNLLGCFIGYSILFLIKKVAFKISKRSPFVREK